MGGGAFLRRAATGRKPLSQRGLARHRAAGAREGSGPALQGFGFCPFKRLDQGSIPVRHIGRQRVELKGLGSPFPASAASGTPLA